MNKRFSTLMTITIAASWAFAVSSAWSKPALEHVKFSVTDQTYESSGRGREKWPDLIRVVWDGGDNTLEERRAIENGASPGAVKKTQGEQQQPGEYERPRIVQLTDEQIAQNGIKLDVAGPGQLASTISLPGKVRINADRLAHVVPRVAGVVRGVRKTLGDSVEAGEVLAVIDSRELAQLKAAYLAAKERVALARATYAREQGLWRKQISAEQDYLKAKQALAEARIEQRMAYEKLRALGFTREALSRLGRDPGQSLSRYGISAPFTGTIIEKDIAKGEAIEANATVFQIADLRTVFVDISVSPKDLAIVRRGAEVVIRTGSNDAQAKGVISHIQPILNEETRKTFARVILDNSTGQWQPGLFITAHIVTGKTRVPLLVPRAALQSLDGEQVVFVQTNDGSNQGR